MADHLWLLKLIHINSLHGFLKITKLIFYFFYFRHGKTTLLRHIASRAFDIPPGIDILYCEQEVVSDDTPAVEAVLKADIKRTELMQLAKDLENKVDFESQERLKEVSFKHMKKLVSFLDHEEVS